MRPQALLALAFGLLAAETLAPAPARLPPRPIVEPLPIERRRNRKVSSRPASSRQIRMAR